MNIAVSERSRGRCRRRAVHSEHREVELVAVVVAAPTEETAAPAALRHAARARGPAGAGGTQDFHDEPAADARPWAATAAATQLHESAGMACCSTTGLPAYSDTPVTVTV